MVPNLFSPSILPVGTIDLSFSSLGLLGQGTNYWPAFLTPLWIIALGICIGAVAAVALFLVLAILSFIPPLGKLADNRKVAVTISVILGIGFTLGLWGLYYPRFGDNEYAFTILLPLAVVGLISGFALVYGMWHRTRAEWGQILTEGVVPYLLGAAGSIVILGLCSSMIAADQREIIESIPRVNAIFDGVQYSPVTVPATDPSIDPNNAPFLPAKISYNLRTTAELRIESDRRVLLADSSDPTSFSVSPVEILPGEPIVFKAADREAPPLPGDPTTLHIQNREIDPATVKFTFTSRPDVPQANSVVVIAVSFLFFMFCVVAFRQAAPRVWALALSTAKNEMAQPLFLLLMTLGIVIVLFFGFFPFNTLGDDIRVLKESGVTLVMVLGMLQAVWSAGTTVSDEIDGRTALTVLSKPVSRRSFILGKYAGIMMAVLVLFAIIAVVFLVVLAYKPIYESRETTRKATTWQEGHDHLMSSLPVFGLYFMETAAVGAVAVALATRLPLLANFITCFAIYVIGNLTQTLVTAGGKNIELVRFVGKLVAVVIPNLNLFNVQAATDVGTAIPVLYLAGTFNYLVCFVVMVWMFAMLLFEDRDLA